MGEVPLYSPTVVLRGARLLMSGVPQQHDCDNVEEEGLYRGTSLIRNRHPVGPYIRTIPRLL